ncbi:unnamed protein product [Urochloa decumbens]|uniref:UspA domain-containing protein n=1 Tax=Urochloa decumbens TaxID=240449 RepID=A0ABC9H7D8_9POAL
MKVVVALDDSDFSRHALAWALDHLFPAAGADADQPAPRPELVLVHALEPLRHIMYPVGPGSAVYGAPSMMESVRAAQAENARALLDRAKRACHQRGVSADAAVVEGEPREALCRAAADMGAGLLVVGSRGLGAIKRAFLGSVSDYCAHHAGCPIMVVKPPRDDDEDHAHRATTSS